MGCSQRVGCRSSPGCCSPHEPSRHTMVPTAAIAHASSRLQIHPPLPASRWKIAITAGGTNNVAHVKPEESRHDTTHCRCKRKTEPQGHHAGMTLAAQSQPQRNTRNTELLRTTLHSCHTSHLHDAPPNKHTCKTVKHPTHTIAVNLPSVGGMLAVSWLLLKPKYLQRKIECK
jgi:hypothetical protein